ncbi:hypothetical protein, partial [Brucella sp. 191011898]|uniref:hypothetical protein n=1 Tax=Brucella sp. 191011898 TaxID=2730447 RepID=UPI001AED7F3C
MANWNEIRFHDNLKRERDRLADCPHITNIENETFRAVIDEILQAVMSSHPRPMGREGSVEIFVLEAIVMERKAPSYGNRQGTSGSASCGA